MDNVNAAGGVGRPPAEPGEMNDLVDDMAGLHLDTLPLIVERAFFFEILKETIPAYDFAWLKWAFGMAQKIPIEPGAVAYTHVPLIFQRINPPRIDPNTLTPLSTDNFEARINGSIKINTDEIRKILPNRIFDQTKEKNYRQIIEDIISTPLIINWEYRFNKLYLTHYNTTPLGTSCLEIRGVGENPAGAGAGGGAGAGAMEGGRRRKRTRTKRRKSKSKKSRRR